MTTNKAHLSSDYNRTATWDDGRTINYNKHFEVQGFTKVSPVYPSENFLATNKEQREALGGGKSCGWRYHASQRREWYVDFDAKAFWSDECC